MQYDAIVLDALNACYRGWYNKRTLCTSDGVPTGLEYGFLQTLLARTREHYPAKVHLAWDGTPARGLHIYPQYKADRDHTAQSKEPAWSPRLDTLRDALTPCLYNLYHPHLEADELIARFVHQQEAAGKTTLILSTDGDMHQLVSNLTHLDCWDNHARQPADIEAQWGCPPHKVPFYRAIAGDTSDNLPSIPRIKKEHKIQLANEARDLDHLIELFTTAPYLSPTQRAKLIDGSAIVRRNFLIMSLSDQTEPPTLMAQPSGDTTPALNLCRRLEFTSLLDKREWRLFQSE